MANAHVNVDGSSGQWKDERDHDVVGDFVGGGVFGDPVCRPKGDVVRKGVPGVSGTGDGQGPVALFTRERKIVR